LFFKHKIQPPDKPFDLSFGAVFTSENKTSLTIQGFYKGENEFIIRFSPTQTGVWQFQTFSSAGALAGLRGSMKADKNNNPNIHGAVAVKSDAPQKFIYQDSTPYFALAFELDWLFALDVDNKNDTPRTKQIIESVKEDGFNQIVMNVYAYDVAWKVAENVPSEYNFRQPSYSVYTGTNEKPDFSQLNISFFNHFDRENNGLTILFNPSLILDLIFNRHTPLSILIVLSIKILISPILFG
jgi:hypothetical protein